VTVLVVTNDFPPRPGGIQTFVYELARRLPPEQVVVFASTWRDCAAFDAEQPFRVVRHPVRVLLPTPGVRSRLQELAGEVGATSVLFGAAAPLGLLGPALRSAGAIRLVALTHGHEAGWAQLPGARRLLRRIGDGVDTVTYLGEYTRRRIAGALSPAAAQRMVRLTPGVDTDVFRPAPADADRIRQQHGLVGRPLVVCVSRLMPRKGQDTLLAAWPSVRAAVTGAALLLVGGGPYRARLQQSIERGGLGGDVVMTGSVPAPVLAGYFGCGDVFAMPCRTRNGGLDVEGLGIVYLEASASGLPVVAGDSGGAPDAVLPDRTGYVVSGTDVDLLTQRLVTLLRDRDLAHRLGTSGRQWVLEEWQWDVQVARLAGLLGVDAASGDLQ
jgi:phosphatidylinositol alpha-1,6-mannosyltransferase